MDVIFHCDAHDGVGFGHLWRCVRLARMLPSLQIGFCGNLSTSARVVLERELSDVSGVNHNLEQTYGVAVIDTMFDEADMDFYDVTRISHIAGGARRAVLLCSAMSAPASLPVDLLIGHVARVPPNANYRFAAGLEYAPVDPEFEAYRRDRYSARENVKTVFLGFGGTTDRSAPVRVLESLTRCEYNGEVIMLESSSHQGLQDSSRFCGKWDLRVLRNVRSVGEILYDVDVVFGSYGHLMFEAMSLGLPFAALAVKPFQYKYARVMEQQHLVAQVGLLETLIPDQIDRTFLGLNQKKRQHLGDRCLKAVDCRGLQRIAKLIEEQLDYNS